MKDLALLNNTGPLNYPTSITDLPREVISQVFHFLDIPTAISLSLVSRQFAPHAEARLWRVLDLDLPLVDPGRLPGGVLKEYASMNIESAIVAEDDKRRRSRAKMRAILCEGGRRRFGMVKKVICRPRPLALSAMMQILDLVSPNLKVLEILGPADNDHWHDPLFDAACDRGYIDTIDSKLIAMDMHFDTLTHIRIQERALECMDSVITICNASPSLISLDVSFETKTFTMRHRDVDPPISSFARKTKLRYLRISQCETPDEEEEDFVSLITSILQHCPLLAQLAILDFANRHEGLRRIAETAAVMERLELLEWPVSPSGFRVALETIERNIQAVAFPSLKRLMLRISTDEELPLADMPGIPHLEQLYNVDEWAYPPPKFDHPARPYEALDPDCAQQWRAASKLRQIQNGPRTDASFPYDIHSLDDTTKYNLTGVISDFGQSPSHLLHVRLLLSHEETCSLPCSAQPEMDYMGTLWDCYTDYKGRVVPREIFHQVLELEGLHDGQWEGKRGNTLGKAALDFLDAWMAESLTVGTGDGTGSVSQKPLQMVKVQAGTIYKS